MSFVHGLLVGLGIGLIGVIATFVYHKLIMSQMQKDLELVKANLQLKVNKIP